MFWRNKRKIDFSSVSSDSRHSQKITLKRDAQRVCHAERSLMSPLAGTKRAS